MKSMIRRTILFFTLLLVCPVYGQQTSEQPAEGEGNRGGWRGGRFGYWRAVLPGGTFVVSLNAITSISQHEYMVDGTARVVEVSIDTTGSVQARFYYIEPTAASSQSPANIGQSGVQMIQERLQQTAENAGLDEIWRKVVKNYPNTTHAHTVEYRLASRDELNRLFESAERSWLRRQSDTFRP